MVDEEKKVDGADQAADSEMEASTLAALETKMAEMRGEESVKDDDSTEVTEEKTDQTDEKEDTDSKKDDSPILPVGHRRAALARGWANEEIDHYLETKPDEAVEKLGEVFDDWQRENSLFSERGRLLKEAGQKASEGDKGEDKKTSDVLPHYDAKALVEEHPGSEDLINALTTPLNAMIDRVNAATEKLTKSEKFVQDTQEDALVTVTQDFLTGKEMEPYRETYGAEIKDVTDEQMQNRLKLFAEADIIIAGAVAHGREITAQNALERAFAIVSQGTRDEGIRQGIRDSMKKRTKTTKSSHQQTSVADENQEISEKELEKRTDARLQAIRNKR